VSRTAHALLLSFLLVTGGSAVADPLRPGGDLTHNDVGSNGFNEIGPNVKGPDNAAFFDGNSFFKDPWVQAPSSTVGRDGLGPVYNATSCSACHGSDGRGIGYTVKNGQDVVSVSLLFRLSEKTPQGIVPHPDYGDQLNPNAIDGVPFEAKPHVTFTMIDGQYADGTSYQLRKPNFTFDQYSLSAFDENTLISPRVGPQIIGLGLVDALSDEAILANADENDANHDGISGRPNYVNDAATGTVKLGRFGWKANQPSLAQQVAGAFNGDMGITTKLFPKQNCPIIQTACAASPSGGENDPDGVEAGDFVYHGVLVYTQTLGVPKRRNPTDPAVVAGEKVFHQVGCAGCHVPSFTTGNDSPVSALRNQTFYPYSDFLLHDMGPDLADNRPDFLATGSEWRTPPLWGLGMIPKVNKHQNLLHDARARGVEEAILWHGGEAAASREAFKKASADDRKNLVSFINDL